MLINYFYFQVFKTWESVLNSIYNSSLKKKKNPWNNFSKDWKNVFRTMFLISYYHFGKIRKKLKNFFLFKNFLIYSISLQFWVNTIEICSWDKVSILLIEYDAFVDIQTYQCSIRLPYSYVQMINSFAFWKDKVWNIFQNKLKKKWSCLLHFMCVNYLTPSQIFLSWDIYSQEIYTPILYYGLLIQLSYLKCTTLWIFVF